MNIDTTNHPDYIKDLRWALYRVRCALDGKPDPGRERMDSFEAFFKTIFGGVA